MSKKQDKTCRCLDDRNLPATEKVQQVVTCGLPTSGNFAQGHDARLKGVLQRAYRSGRKLQVKGSKAIDPMVIADEFGWGYLMEAPERKPRQQEQIDDLVVKVGRWTYPVLMTADTDQGKVEVHYLTKDGKTKTATVRPDAIVAA